MLVTATGHGTVDDLSKDNDQVQHFPHDSSRGTEQQQFPMTMDQIMNEYSDDSDEESETESSSSSIAGELDPQFVMLSMSGAGGAAAGGIATAPAPSTGGVGDTTTRKLSGSRTLSITPEMRPWVIDSRELTFVDKLGIGSSAKVYKGIYRSQQVAVKVLKSMPEGKQLTDFQKEFEIMSSLRSPHVVYFYGTVLVPKICIITEFCSRGSLCHALQEENTSLLDWPRIFKLCIETARGINCLHGWRPQIVHRDLKTLNLLLDDNWTVKVADFGMTRKDKKITLFSHLCFLSIGLSRFLSDRKQSTLGKLRGTYAYTAPEIYFGEQYTAQSDVYSMGMVTML